MRKNGLIAMLVILTLFLAACSTPALIIPKATEHYDGDATKFVLPSAVDVKVISDNLPGNYYKRCQEDNCLYYSLDALFSSLKDNISDMLNQADIPASNHRNTLTLSVKIDDMTFYQNKHDLHLAITAMVRLNANKTTLWRQKIQLEKSATDIDTLLMNSINGFSRQLADKLIADCRFNTTVVRCGHHIYWLNGHE
ncbi:MAG: hypothetical protein ACO2ZM_06285 [Francisellaceae bacterium]